jgi:4-amino-4-deoxychorismate lyase
MNLCLINGEIGVLAPDHRALAYGDGIFETIRIAQGQANFLEKHLNRMNLGIQMLKLNFSEADMSALRAQLTEIIQPLDSTHVLKIMLLRQFPGRGYGYDSIGQSVDTVIQVSPYKSPDWIIEGARVDLAETFISENASLKGIKHLNRLDSVIAKASVNASEIDEVLLTTQKGLVVEGSMANIFFCEDNSWFTPKITTAGIEGIIRNYLLESFDEIKETNVDVKNLNKVESAFICNSLIGIVPIKTLSKRPLIISEAMSTFRKEIEQTC